MSKIAVLDYGIGNLRSAEKGLQKVGADFNAASNAGTVNTGTPQHRGAESPLGNLIAEIALWTVNDFGLDADFGIMNPGGLRSDLDADRYVALRY